VIPRGRQDNLGGRCGDFRCRADRRDRARDQARRHRLPDPPGRNRRPRSALRTSGDDIVGCARYLLQRAADPGDRHPAGDIDALLAAIKRRALEHKDTVCIGRSPRHPRRAGDLRAEAGGGLRRIRPLPRAAGGARAEIATCAISGAVGTFANIDPRSRSMSRSHGPCRRAGLDPGDPARPPRHVLSQRLASSPLRRAARHRDPPPAAHRGAARRRNISRRARRARRRCRTSATRC
jgi:hypothetical protein